MGCDNLYMAILRVDVGLICPKCVVMYALHHVVMCRAMRWYALVPLKPRQTVSLKCRHRNSTVVNIHQMKLLHIPQQSHLNISFTSPLNHPLICVTARYDRNTACTVGI
jgi:hypothetical protein